MGAVKKMLEQEIPGIHVLSLMVGKNVIEVKKTKKTIQIHLFWSIDSLHCLKLQKSN